MSQTKNALEKFPLQAGQADSLRCWGTMEKAKWELDRVLGRGDVKEGFATFVSYPHWGMEISFCEVVCNVINHW